MHERDGGGEFFVSDDPALLDVDVVHGFLRTSYWSPRIPRGVVETALRNSLCFGVYRREGGGRTQVGFARLVTDRATFAYLADVFVLEEHRGKGLSKLLMGAIMSHPEVQNLRRWMLCTRDAHGLYARFGFHAPRKPEVYMERHDPGVYDRM